LITLDPSSPTPPFEQIRVQLANKIADGELVAGSRLPTVRHLAENLGLAVNTVARAYRELELAGLVETRGRGGTVVSSAGDQTREQLRVSAQQYAQLAHDLGVNPAEALRLARAALNPSSANRDLQHPDEASVRTVEVAISRPEGSDAEISKLSGGRHYPGQDFPECQPVDLELSLHWDAVDGALGGRLEARNGGRGACRLSGKPMLIPLGNDGAPLPTDFVVTLENAEPGFVVLQPGRSAIARVSWASWDGEPATSRTVVSWPGGAKEITSTGPSQPNSRGLGGARNLSSSWFRLVESPDQANEAV
jgi:DNA-binding transcriptional regulator YhcF (GntR family)